MRKPADWARSCNEAQLWLDLTFKRLAAKSFILLPNPSWMLIVSRTSRRYHRGASDPTLPVGTSDDPCCSHFHPGRRPGESCHGSTQTMAG